MIRAGRAAVILASCLLAACASTGGGSGELKTASDQTAAEKRASIRVQLAVGYYQDGKYEIALDEVKQAIAAEPGNAEAYGLRALIYTAMGQLPLADETYQQALRLEPGNPELANNYGSFLCQSMDKPAQAMPYFDAALANPVYQSPVSALLNAGSCSLKLKNLDGAERYLLQALRYDPDHATTNATLARVYYERRDMARAGFFINRLKATAKMDTLTPDILWLAIRIDRRLGDTASETAMATQLRRHHPGSPEYAALQRGAFDE